MNWNRAALSLAVALAALACGVRSLVASNMGFIVSCPMTAAGPTSRSGTHTLNLPYQRDAQMFSAKDVFADLGGVSNVTYIAKFLETTDGTQVHTGRKGDGGLDWLNQNGAGWFVKLIVPVDYVVGGSSDPALVLNLNAAGSGSASGTNFVGLPYHATADTASELMNDIGFASVASVQRFVTATDGLLVYTGRKGSPPDFPLNPCESYFIKMNTTVNYIPSHY